MDILPGTLTTLARAISHGHSRLQEGLVKSVFNKQAQKMGLGYPREGDRVCMWHYPVFQVL